MPSVGCGIAVVLLALARRATCAWSAGDAGITNNGRNISTSPLPSNATSDCYAACVADAACVAWQVRFASPACGATASCTLKSNYGGDGADTRDGARVPCGVDACAASGPVVRGGPLLQPLAFTPVDLSRITPTGWLADELYAQSAVGLTGKMARFWAPVSESVWVGGTADGYLHEDAPYFLNGASPLSVLLAAIGRTDPSGLAAQVQTFVDAIVANQSASGWLGPDDTRSGDQYWARFNVVSTFIQHAEGHPDQARTLIPAVLRYVREATRRALAGPFQVNDWSAARAHDFVISLHYLLDRFDVLSAAGLVPDGITEATLYDAAAVVHAQALGNGAVWEDWFASPTFPRSTVTSNFGMLTHGVNVAQAIKTGGVWWRQHANSSLRDSTFQRMGVLDTFHGSPTGVVQADEHLAGKEPQHGTELCGIVEALFSYETLGDVFGDVLFFDRAELIAFNAMPGGMTKDLAAHNYLSQANEAVARVSDPHVWVTDGPYALIYGLAPNFVCCTANHPQGWPKFAARLIKATPDGGVAVTMWAPTDAVVSLGAGAGDAAVSVITDYPFDDSALVTVAAPVGTRVRLRIPVWASSAQVCAGTSPCAPAANGTFHVAVTTAASMNYTVHFNPTVRVESFSAGSVAVYRGALVYALQIGENVTTIARTAAGFNDSSVSPTTQWNVALVVDDAANPAASLEFTQVSRPSSPLPFARAPVTLTGRGRVLPDWTLVNNSAAVPPASPVDCTHTPCGDEVPITLVPFGSTLLRIAALPWTVR